MIEPTPLPDGFVCPEGTVPGWLNVDGLPTACVGDLPMVHPPIGFFDEGELIPPVEVVPSAPVVEPSPDVLAETGVDAWSALLVGVLLLMVGGWMLWARRGIGS